MGKKISAADREKLKQQRAGDWLALVQGGSGELPTVTTVFTDGSNGAGAVPDHLPLLSPCSQRELQWIAQGQDVAQAPTAGQVAGTYSPNGTADNFLPTVLQVQYLARIYLSKDQGRYAGRVIYSGGIGKFATMTVHHPPLDVRSAPQVGDASAGVPEASMAEGGVAGADANAAIRREA